MATTKEIKEHVEIALKEIGKITPWYDSEVNEWVFKHSNYPVEYGGSSPAEVVKNYPKYLREFIKHRLDNTLNPLTEKRTKGHGGKRQGSGRPHGSVKEHKTRMYVPDDIAEWLKHPKAFEQVRKLMQRTHTA